MIAFHNKNHLSVSIKLFITSGVIRILIILGILLLLWIAIIWSTLLS